MTETSDRRLIPPYPSDEGVLKKVDWWFAHGAMLLLIGLYLLGAAVTLWISREFRRRFPLWTGADDD